MIITISGKPGSGKSTAAKMLAHKLGYRYFSTGDFRGELAMKHGMTIDELNAVGMKEKWTDTAVDDEVARMGREEDNIVLDTWLGFHFVPKAVKIFLDIDPVVASRRVFKHQRPDEMKQDSAEGMQRMLDARWEQTRKRYIKHYRGVDISDLGNYDLVIDTTSMRQGDVVDMISAYMQQRNL